MFKMSIIFCEHKKVRGTSGVPRTWNKKKLFTLSTSLRP